MFNILKNFKTTIDYVRGALKIEESEKWNPN